MKPEGLQKLLDREYETTRDVADGLTAVEAWCLPQRDLRGVFASAYLHITRQIMSEVGRSGFSDCDWVEQYLVAFGNLYRSSLLNYESGNFDRVPKAWRLAFDAARDKSGLIIQHLTLGINAHINHDLAVALVEVGINPGRDGKYADHTAINVVLEGATEGLKDTVARMYAPVLRRADRLFGRVDDEITLFSIPKAREHAWASAIALDAARTDRDRDVLLRALDEQAAVVARLILSSPTRHPVLLRVVEAASRADALLRALPWRRRR